MSTGVPQDEQNLRRLPVSGFRLNVANMSAPFSIRTFSDSQRLLPWTGEPIQRRHDSQWQ